VIAMRRWFLSVMAAAGAALVVSSQPLTTDVYGAARVLEPRQQQREFFLTLGSGGKNPRLAVPDFLVQGTDGDLAGAAKVLADVLWNDLDFEREFLMVPRKVSASFPPAPADALPIERWAEITDAVLVGSVSRNGDTLIVKVEIVSVRPTASGQRGFGAEYGNCRVQNPRFCAHSIADHIHKEAMNLDGVARTRLAFSSDRDGSRMAGRLTPDASTGKEIYLSDYDGANPFRMTVNRSLNISPSWSPAGGFLAYTSYQSGEPDIYVANLGQVGRAPARPAQGNDRIHNQMASWSPDGSRLAFVSNRSGRTDVWIVNRDGGGLQNLTNSPNQSVSNWAPTWSPSGTQIAFASDRAGQKYLYVMNVNGTGLRLLVNREIDRPTWSREDFIAFTMATGAGYDIALYDFGTQAIRVLTDGLGQNESPAVAPNGRHVAFVTTRWGRQEIATVNAAGGHIRRVTQTGNNTYPSWQPMSPLK
jgi:TolB protein